MIPVNKIRENSQLVIDRLCIKNFDATQIVCDIIELDNRRKELQNELDTALAEANGLAKEIGDLFKSGNAALANEKKGRTAELKVKSKELEEKLEEVKTTLLAANIQLPNIPCELVPVGRVAEDNQIVYEEGTIPQLDSNAMPHWELCRKYDIIDWELGVKVTGAGFPFYKGKGARLQRALINFFLDNAIKAGYTEIQPPLMVNEASGFGTGQLPDKEGQMYHIPLDGFYMIPTAEVPVTNIYRDVILKSDELPVRNVAYSNCFRREAGSYGKDVRGLNRLHQFDKIEIVQIVNPADSYAVLEQMKDYVSTLVRKLELPFRILRLCGGDMSFASAMTYDFEVYSAAQQRWLEVSSVSNFEDFQANRLKCRYKDESGKMQLCHSLNGSAMALPRIVAALLENNQTPEGIRIPKALVPYIGMEFID